MKMTKTEALTTALNAMTMLKDIAELTDTQIEKIDTATEWLDKMKAQLNRPRAAASSEKATATAEKRKAETAAARAALVAEIKPILRKHLTTDVTVKELTEAAADELPADFTWHKVQNILSRELAPELIRTERKRGGDLYRLAQ